jgi:hypothetical protein
VKDVKVINGEECIKQHKLLVAIMDTRQSVEHRPAAFVSKCKIWKLKDADTRLQFQRKVTTRAEGMAEAGVGGVWKELKKCLLQVSDEVCGRTKGPPRFRQTWWWTDDVAKAVAEKRTLYQRWRKSKDGKHETEYREANRMAKKVIYLAKERQRRQFGEWLEKEDMKGRVLLWLNR